MSIFIDKHELAERKDIINPNLLKDSKNIIIDKNHYTAGDLNGNNWWLTKYLNAPLQAGDSITLSFYVNSMIGGKYNNSLGLNLWQNNYHALMASTPSYKFKLNTLNIIHWTATTSDDVPQIALYGGDNLNASGPNTQIKLSYFKIERGINATPWCPAIQDYVMKSDFDALKAEIEQLKQK